MAHSGRIAPRACRGKLLTRSTIVALAGLKQLPYSSRQQCFQFHINFNRRQYIKQPLHESNLPFSGTSIYHNMEIIHVSTAQHIHKKICLP